MNRIVRFITSLLQITPRFAVRTDIHPRNTIRTIILLHGIASSSRVWRSLLSAVRTDDTFDATRVMALDLPGFGKASSPRWYGYDYTAYRKSLRRTLRKLRIDTPVILVGHSMGGLIALDYAKYYPDEVVRLMLVSPPLFRPADISNLPDRFYGKAYGTIADNHRKPIFGAVGRLISTMSSFEHHALATQAFREDMKNIILNPENWQMAQQVKLPTTMICGRFDPLVLGANLAVLAKTNPHMTLIATTSGHDVTGAKISKLINTLRDSRYE